MSMRFFLSSRSTGKRLLQSPHAAFHIQNQHLTKRFFHTLPPKHFYDNHFFGGAQETKSFHNLNDRTTTSKTTNNEEQQPKKRHPSYDELEGSDQHRNQVWQRAYEQVKSAHSTLEETMKLYQSKPKSYELLVSVATLFGALVLLYYSFGRPYLLSNNNINTNNSSKSSSKGSKSSSSSSGGDDASATSDKNDLSIYYHMLIDSWFQYIDNGMFSSKEMATKICKELEALSFTLSSPLSSSHKSKLRNGSRRSSDAGSDGSSGSGAEDSVSVIEFVKNWIEERRENLVSLFDRDQVVLSAVSTMIRLKNDSFFEMPTRNLIEANVIGVLVNIITKTDSGKNGDAKKLKRVYSILHRLTSDANLHDQIVNHRETMSAIYDGILNCEDDQVRTQLENMCQHLIRSEICYPRICKENISDQISTRHFLNREFGDAQGTNQQAMKVYMWLSSNGNERMKMLALNRLDVRQDDMNTVYVSVHLKPEVISESVMMATYAYIRWMGENHNRVPTRYLRKFILPPLMGLMFYRSILSPVTKDLSKQAMPYFMEGTGKFDKFGREQFSVSTGNYFLFYNALNVALPTMVYLLIFKRVKYLMFPFLLSMPRYLEELEDNE